jgi:ketosteroid isomerase-like protein
MMDPKATVQTVMDSVQKGDFAKAQSLLAEDFQFSGPVPDPISGQEWMDMSKNLKAAFPDLDYHFDIADVQGNTVRIEAHLSGTHRGDLDLTAMHMGVIPATNKHFSAAHEHGEATVQDGKVKTWAMTPTEDAGLIAILGQLGVKVPTM